MFEVTPPKPQQRGSPDFNCHRSSSSLARSNRTASDECDPSTTELPIPVNSSGGEVLSTEVQVSAREDPEYSRGFVTRCAKAVV